MVYPQSEVSCGTRATSIGKKCRRKRYNETASPAGSDFASRLKLKISRKLLVFLKGPVLQTDVLNVDFMRRLQMTGTDRIRLFS